MSFTIYVKQGPNKWDVTVEVTETVSDLKKKIAEVSSIPVENQRLIYSGKILKDDHTLESYKVQEEHVIHLVKSGGNNRAGASSSTAATTSSSSSSSTATTTTNNNNNSSAPHNLSAGQNAGFNPLNDLTGARYAGYGLNLPSVDMFGPDGGLTESGPNQEDVLRMMENPIFQSQMNEMLSNPQMIDFLIQSNPQLQALGPQARQMFQSPMFRQMLTNPAMLRQSMQMAEMMGLNRGMDGFGSVSNNNNSDFPAPGGEDTTTETNNNNNNNNNNSATSTNNNTQSPSNNMAQNPFAALLNPSLNPFANLSNINPNSNNTSSNNTTNNNNWSNYASFLEAMMPPVQQQQPEDTRPPEERYEQQLRQLNDMGFFDFDRNVAALRRSGGSVQGAVDALLNGSV
ncbi:ubiquitin domain-containing protein DSK2 PWA37_000684 [Arxiozyma heterogenica]|uniref:Ubiquitin domain-containing protein DSK2 n=1 Tax=Arxiozyma heterogenica TaxID=278026 RepID=A0AAN7ZYX5_9SACH|nr:hypothetical protein RI543_000572 [Kazachstania heterogenica]